MRSSSEEEASVFDEGDGGVEELMQKITMLVKSRVDESVVSSSDSR